MHFVDGGGGSSLIGDISEAIVGLPSQGFDLITNGLQIRLGAADNEYGSQSGHAQGDGSTYAATTAGYDSYKCLAHGKLQGGRDAQERVASVSVSVWKTSGRRYQIRW
jgi:hypothetical protein